MSKRSIVLRGFYGNANCGDEALLQSIWSTFAPDFDIIISVNDVHRAARLAKEGIFPYNKAEQIVPSVNVSVMGSQKTAGLFLGGGGLGLGFGWDQYIFAWRQRKKIIHSGVHITGEYYEPSLPGFNDMTSSFLRAADYFSVRHKASVRECDRLGVKAELLPDWAYALEAEKGAQRDPYVVVTIRGNAAYDSEATRLALEEIHLYCKANGLDAIALPFAEMDRALCERLMPWATVVSDLYFKPREAKGLIGGAMAAFTFGRYHPIVFSLSENVPVFSIDPLRQGLSGDKTCLELVENGLADFFFHLGKLPTFDANDISRHVARFRSGEIYGHAFATYGRHVAEASRRMVEILHS